MDSFWLVTIAVAIAAAFLPVAGTRTADGRTIALTLGAAASLLLFVFAVRWQTAGSLPISQGLDLLLGVSLCFSLGLAGLVMIALKWISAWRSSRTSGV